MVNQQTEEVVVMRTDLPSQPPVINAMAFIYSAKLLQSLQLMIVKVEIEVT